LLSAFADHAGLHGGLESVCEQMRGLVAVAADKLHSAERRRAASIGRREMGEALQEALRTVGAHGLGAGYNVVREVLMLPVVAAASRERQAQQRDAFESACACELDGLLAHAPLDERHALMEAAHEGHEMARAQAVYRGEAANAAWDAQLTDARARLSARDAQLVADDGAAFWATVRTTSDAMSANPACADFGRTGLCAHDVDVAATLLRTHAALAGVRALILSGNPFGDAGVTALADACRHGALQHTQRLYLDNVHMGDGGLAELAAALGSAPLSELSFLDLTRNQIADDGMAALAQALARGALPNLKTLYLYNNQIGSAGLAAFAETLMAAGAPHGLQTLYVDNNLIGEAGVAALVRALEAGHLPGLRSLHLSGNRVPPAMVKAAVDLVEGQAGPRLRPAPQTRDLESAPVE
jgi:hypothetical protein